MLNKVYRTEGCKGISSTSSKSLYCIQSLIQNMFCSVPEMTKALEDKQPCTMGELEGCYTHVKRGLQLEACKLQKFFQSLVLYFTLLQNSG